jgi:signal transduction histidine kinase
VRPRLLGTESFRLALLYAGVFAVSMALLGAFTLATIRSAMRDQIVTFSRADLAAIRDGFVHEGVDEAREVTLQEMAAVGKPDFLLLQQDGRRLAGNLPVMRAAPGIFEMPSPVSPGHVILGVGVELAPGLFAFAGSDLAYVDAVQARILRVMLWLFGGALLLAGVGGALVSRRFLARTDAIARTCRAIMAGNMKDRIPLRGGQDEIDRLAATVNAMLDRIAALMENLRQVSNDVAHDLRTPLTHLRPKLEQARAQAHSTADYEAALDGAIASADRMLSLFAGLLRIAQIEGGARRAGFAPVDLAGILRKLGEVYGAVAEDSGHSLKIAPAPPCTVSGDPELLFQMLANLVENAIVHTPAGTQIGVGLEIGGAQAVLRVTDDGPGIPPAARDKIFQRFYRLDASRSTPGHGLGLALVAAVAELHGGTVAVAPESPGLTVTLTLPLNA